MVQDKTENDICNSEETNVQKESPPKSPKQRPGLMYVQKQKQIAEALACDPPDIAKLRQFAISPGGFVTDDLRRKAWPKLLNIDIDNIPPKPDEEVLHAHRDYNQVVLDVNRSLKRFPPGMDEDIRLGMQDQLVDLIMRVLVRHDELHYYQGFHDICVTFLLVVGEDVAFALVDKLSQNHLRDFMEKSEVGTIFSLSWLITWYGHVLPDLKDIVRCYDFFIACHALMPIYLAAAIVLHRKEEVLSSECEMCVLHSLLSKIPEDLPYESLIVKAGQLFLQFSPDQLAKDAILTFKKQQSLAKARIQNRPRNHRKDVRRNFLVSLFLMDGHHTYLKLTFWTLTAVCSAVVIAYFKPDNWELSWWS